MQGGEHLAERRHRVGDRAPVLAAVHRMVEGPDFDEHRDDAAERDGERGLPGPPVAAVGQDHCVGGEQIAVLGQELGEVLGARLLLALDEGRHADGRPSVPSADRALVHGDAGLVVAGASAEETAVALDGLVGRRGPELERPFRLDVVMGVEQDRRRPVGRGNPSEHGGVRPFHLQDLGLHACGVEELARGTRRLADVRRVELEEAHRGDADELLEVRADRRHEVRDALLDRGCVECAHAPKPTRARRSAISWGCRSPSERSG